MKEQTPLAEKTKSNETKHTVWIGHQDRIASFHPVENYTPQSFLSYETFHNFLRGLQECGYKFQ